MAIIKKKKPQIVTDGVLQNTIGNLPAVNVQIPQFGGNGGGNWNRDNNPWYQQQQALMRQLSSREPYKFDLDASALYQAIKDDTIRQGQRAMQDTMGQAAALTGGYGSSYAQGAGQQAYNDFLTQLNEQIPQIAAQERAAYDADTDRLYQQLQLAGQMYGQQYSEAMAERDWQHQLGREAVGDEQWQQQFEQNKLQDALSEAWRQRQFDADMAQQARENAWTERSWAAQQEETAYSRAMDMVDRALSYGFDPSDNDLAAAGLTRSQYNTAKAFVSAQRAAARSSGSGSSGSGSNSTSANETEKHTSVVPIINGPESLSPTGKALYKSLGNITGNPFEYIMRAYKSADMPEEQKESEINYWLKVYQMKKA